MHSKDKTSGPDSSSKSSGKTHLRPDEDFTSSMCPTKRARTNNHAHTSAARSMSVVDRMPISTGPRSAMESFVEGDRAVIVRDHEMRSVVRHDVVTPYQPTLKSPSTSSAEKSPRLSSERIDGMREEFDGDLAMLRDFRSIVRSPDKTWFSMMQCLVLLHYECDVHPNTLHLATQMAARFLSKQTFLQTESEANLRLIASLAIFSSAKFEDGYSLRVSKFLQSIGGGYEEDTFLRAEVSFCHLVDFDFFQSTRFSEGMHLLTGQDLCHVATDVSQKYVRVKQNFLNKVTGKNSTESLRMGFLVRYLLELSLWDLDMFQFSVTQIAKAATHLATRHYLPGCSEAAICQCENVSKLEIRICQRLHALAQCCGMDSELGRRYYGDRLAEKMRSNKTTIKYTKTAFLGVPDLTWASISSKDACFLA